MLSVKTQKRSRFLVIGLFAIAAFACFSGSVSSASAAQIPDELKGAQITEHLGDPIDLNLVFSDETGKKVPLSTYFKSGKPVLLNPVYYDCPNLCSLVMNGMLEGLKTLSWTPGREFEVVSFSIDDREKPELAAKKKEAYLASFGRPEAAAGWHFLTGDAATIRRLADQVGFGFRYDPGQKQFAHSAALILLTPEGRVSRYLYGISFAQKDLRLALLEASGGKIGTIVDRIFMFCFEYNPMTRKYSLYLTQLMRVACFATILILGGYLALFWRRQALRS